MFLELTGHVQHFLAPWIATRISAACRNEGPSNSLCTDRHPPPTRHRGPLPPAASLPAALRVLHLRQLLIAGLHVLHVVLHDPPGPCTCTACTGLLDPWASLRPPPVSASHPVMLPVPTAPGTPFLCPPASLSCPTQLSHVAPRQLGGLLPTPHHLQPHTQPCSPPRPPAGCAGSGEVTLPSPSSPGLAASPCMADTVWLVRSTPKPQTQQKPHQAALPILSEAAVSQ